MISFAVVLGCVMGLAGCAGDTGVAGAADASDADADGYSPAEGDCDDRDPARYPGADEVCDGDDDDCDGVTDDHAADAGSWYADVDGDGYGDAASETSACVAPTGFVAVAGDCDDRDPGIHPGASEVCGGADEDCDGFLDLGAVDAMALHHDEDGDGFGDPDVASTGCEAPDGYTSDGSDCDDHDSGVSPGAPERCNGSDDDCDGDADEDAIDAPTWYADADGDGFGDATAPRAACEAPAGFVESATDCDDMDAGVSPGTPEHCDGVDEDCDGAADDDPVAAPTWYADVDADTWGDPAVTRSACAQPTDYVATAGDCVDRDPGVHPEADERCDGVDDDCDGAIDEDEAVDAGTWYGDGDGDGYGDPSVPDVACSAPIGFVSPGTDCDDGDPEVRPSGLERCDGLDDDCDGEVDEGDAADAPTWYVDADADGYGDPARHRAACAQPDGYLADATDCDDRSAATHPGAAERCNGADDNCDGAPDEGAASDAPTWHADTDADGYGSGTDTLVRCEAPSGYIADGDDCDDADDAVNPDGVEILGDAVDEDCDGYVDADARYFGGRVELAGYGGVSGGGIAPAGDIDGDGYDDVLIGAVFHQESAWNLEGIAYLVLGSEAPASASLPTSAIRYVGVGWDAAGRVAGAGDVNRDGYDDFLVGATGHASGDGAVYLVLGAASPTSESLASASAVYTGEGSDDAAGISVSGTGDFDGDGYADFLVGAYGNDDGGANAGAAYLVAGGSSPASMSLADATEFTGAAAGDYAGWAVAGAADVNGDGYSDGFVAAIDNMDGGRYAGAAYLLLGEPIPSSGSLSGADAEYTGAAFDGAGWAIAGGGDVNDDGYFDLLVGANDADPVVDGDSVGAAYLVLGQALPSSQPLADAEATYTGVTTGDYAGYSVAFAGDVDGDAFDDMVVSAVDSAIGGTGSGAAYLVYGGSSPASISLADSDRVYAGREGDHLGWSVAAAGDVNADALADFLLASPDNEDAASQSGAVDLVLGRAR